MKKRFWYFVGGIMLVSGMFGCTNTAAAKKAKMQIVNSENKAISKLDVIEGDSFQLKYSVSKKTKLVWRSSKTSVAKVSKKGKIKTYKKGKAKIYLMNKSSGEKVTCKVTVKKRVMPKKLSVIGNIQTCYVGGEVTLQMAISPKNSVYRDIEWKSSNDKVAEVTSSGVIKGKMKGSCKITATIAKTKVKKKIKIKVLNVPVGGLSVPYTSYGITLQYGDKYRLAYTVLPANATDKTVTFRSSDNSVVSVDSKGEMTGMRPGHTYVTIQTKDGKKVSKIPVRVKADKGMLTKSILSRYNLTCIDNLMIVAHPDDETIFGGGHLASSDYLVVCLTNGYKDFRKNEFNNAMAATNDKGIILQYPDIEDGVRSNWESVKSGILSDLKLLLTYKKWKKIVTHNPDGEYGHIHHKMTNKYVTQIYNSTGIKSSSDLFYFGKYYKPDQVKKYLTNEMRLDNDLLSKKEAALKMYKSQGMVGYLSHMNPYEVWVKSDAWS